MATTKTTTIPIVADFPSLSPAEFELCCLNLQEQLHACAGEAKFESVEARKESGQCYLLIKKRLDNFFKTKPALTERMNSEYIIEEGEEEEEEEEEEGEGQLTIAKHTACRTSSSSGDNSIVEYHIVLSPVYQVPVLYFSATRLRTLQCVYDNLVPKSLHLELKANCSPVMGALSFGENPVNGLSMFFIHPCNTAHAMYELGPSIAGTVKQYLVVWMGIIASYIGLYIPLAATSHSVRPPATMKESMEFLR